MVLHQHAAAVGRGVGSGGWLCVRLSVYSGCGCCTYVNHTMHDDPPPHLIDGHAAQLLLDHLLHVRGGDGRHTVVQRAQLDLYVHTPTSTVMSSESICLDVSLMWTHYTSQAGGNVRRDSSVYV